MEGDRLVARGSWGSWGRVGGRGVEDGNERVFLLLACLVPAMVLIVPVLRVFP